VDSGRVLQRQNLHRRRVVPDRGCHATVYDPVNDGIYMFGGSPSGTLGSHVNLCQRYDPAADTWTLMASMPDGRGWIGGAYCNGRIYIVAGYTNGSASSDNNWEYDIAANTWTAKTVLPRATVAYMAATWRDSLVYILGGTTPGLTGGVADVDIYNPATNTWAIGTPMPLPGDMSSAVIVGDTIYVTNAYNRGTATLWGRMLRGAINPASPTQITWLWDPMLLGGPHAVRIVGLARHGFASQQGLLVRRIRIPSRHRDSERLGLRPSHRHYGYRSQSSA